MDKLFPNARASGFLLLIVICESTIERQVRTAYEPSAQLHRTGLRLTWSLGHEATRSTGTLLDGCQTIPSLSHLAV